MAKKEEEKKQEEPYIRDIIKKRRAEAEKEKK